MQMGAMWGGFVLVRYLCSTLSPHCRCLLQFVFCTGSVAIESHSANVRPTEQIVTRSQPVTGGGQTGLSIVLNSCPGVTVMMQCYLMGSVAARKL